MIQHHIRTQPVGVNGLQTVWDLTAGEVRTEFASGTVTSRSVGPRLVAENVEGMGDPEVDVFSAETPRGAGQVRSGTRAKVRKVFLPILFEQTGNDWTEIQRRFWASVSPDYPVWWRVYTDGSSYRDLPIYLDPTDTVYPRDPTQVRQIIGVALVADAPYWLGPEQVAATAQSADETLFFGPANNAPPFFIVPGSQDGGQTFVVGGDVDVWPVLEVYGPASAFTASDVARVGSVSAGFNIAAGQKLVIDFDPMVQTAMLRSASATSGGTNMTPSLITRDFFPIKPPAPQTQQTVSLSMLGSGQARMTYRPKYRRAV